mmetsp:Transcript_40320/g.121450  ORF Transcript_40320/g.121450 Transcript_40320/m.121450 type:complete len:247 (+) Transcript_40320:625-1365(+)
MRAGRRTSRRLPSPGGRNRASRNPPRRRKIRRGGTLSSKVAMWMASVEEGEAASGEPSAGGGGVGGTTPNPARRTGWPYCRLWRTGSSTENPCRRGPGQDSASRGGPRPLPGPAPGRQLASGDDGTSMRGKPLRCWKGSCGASRLGPGGSYAARGGRPRSSPICFSRRTSPPLLKYHRRREKEEGTKLEIFHTSAALLKGRRVRRIRTLRILPVAKKKTKNETATTTPLSTTFTTGTSRGSLRGVR